jgi:hypothetical protein
MVACMLIPVSEHCGNRLGQLDLYNHEHCKLEDIPGILVCSVQPGGSGGGPKAANGNVDILRLLT